MTTHPEPALAGRYRLHGLIGAGGMADVHRATDLLLGRDVAVKVLRPRPDDPEAAHRFRAEARTLAAVSSPHVITILDVSPPDAPGPYLVMEIVDGPSLAQRLRSGGPLDEVALRRLCVQLARGLAAAHARGIVHRDVKPGNVLLRPDGTAVLTDFGIARLHGDDAEVTPAGKVVGSPAYLAPEQVRASPLTPAVDVYACGLVLLESWTGLRAYPGPSVEAALARLAVSPAIPASLPSDLRALVVAMTAQDPEQRPSAAEIVALLDPDGAHPAAAAEPAVVLTEELRLPVGGVAPALAAVAPAAPAPAAAPTGRGRRRRAGRVVILAAAVVALIAFWLTDPLRLGVQGDPGPAQDGPSSPLTPVADPEPVAPTSETTPTPVARTVDTDGAQGGGGAAPERAGKDSGQKPDVADRKGQRPSGEKGKGGGKGRR